MYEPLQFLEQIDNYLRVDGCPTSILKEVNDNAHKFISDLGRDNVISMYFDAQKILAKYEGSSLGEKKLRKKYSQLFESWKDRLKVMPPEPEDFFDVLSFSQIRSEWRKNKVVYKVDKDFIDTLIYMNTPELILTDFVVKQPAGCYYIDFDGNCPFCRDSFGCFILNSVIENEASYLLIVSLINDKKTGRVMPIKTKFMLPLDREDGVDLTKFKITERGESNLSITAENGEQYVLNEQLLSQFFINFSIYLHASNREVKESEVTKRTYKKLPKDAEPKNSFKEVKQYEVGFRYGTAVRASKKVIKRDSKVSKPNKTENSRQITSHYRSAHWHSYWVGSGEDKELTVKWVEGVFVQGSKESNDVVIHEVKPPRKNKK